jgi:hypothetical protein
MQDSVDPCSFEYVRNDSRFPGVIDLTYMERMTDDDLTKLVRTLQSNQNATALLLPCCPDAVGADSLRKLAEPLSNMTALQELDFSGTIAFLFCFWLC